MEIQSGQPIDPPIGTDPVQPVGIPAGEDGQRRAFQTILETLERLRIEGKGAGKGAVDDTGLEALEEFDQAVDKVDRLHRTAMDLKHRLEESFRLAMDQD